MNYNKKNKIGTLLLGAISQKMYTNNKDLKRMLCPLLKCHLKLNTYLHIITKNDKTEQVISLSQHPIPSSNINKILQNEKKLYNAMIPFSIDNFHITNITGIEVTCSPDNPVSGVVWSTQRTDSSNMHGLVEYWLTTEDMNPSKFLIAYFSKKNISESCQQIISYQVYSLSNGILINGTAYVGEGETIIFSRLASLS